MLDGCLIGGGYRECWGSLGSFFWGGGGINFIFLAPLSHNCEEKNEKTKTKLVGCCTGGTGL